MSDFDKVKTLAHELSRGFESVKDSNGEPLTRDHITVRTLNDATNKRFQEVCHKAHGNMLPDDWRYSMIEEAADTLSESESEDDYNERISQIEAPIMNAALLAYIASHGARFNGYADQALEEYGMKDFMQACGMAWHLEFQEVAGLLYSALSEMANDEPDAEEEAANG